MNTFNERFDEINEKIAGCICKHEMYEQVHCGVHGIYAVKAKSFFLAEIQKLDEAVEGLKSNNPAYHAYSDVNRVLEKVRSLLKEYLDN